MVGRVVARRGTLYSVVVSDPAGDQSARGQCGQRNALCGQIKHSAFVGYFPRPPLFTTSIIFVSIKLVPHISVIQVQSWMMLLVTIVTGQKTKKGDSVVFRRLWCLWW